MHAPFKILEDNEVTERGEFVHTYIAFRKKIWKSNRSNDKEIEYYGNQIWELEDKFEKFCSNADKRDRYE